MPINSFDNHLGIFSQKSLTIFSQKQTLSVAFKSEKERTLTQLFCNLFRRSILLSFR